ncbi:hypothetical protein BJX76DRAFT_260020 [Aspergillus varians]
MDLSPLLSPRSISLSSGYDKHACQVTMLYQNVPYRYIQRRRLKQLLEELFPEVEDFHIQMIEDQWLFAAPRIVTEDELDTAQDY